MKIHLTCSSSSWSCIDSCLGRFRFWPFGFGREFGQGEPSLYLFPVCLCLPSLHDVPIVKLLARENGNFGGNFPLQAMSISNSHGVDWGTGNFFWPIL